MDSSKDRIPTDAELDALQAEIEQVKGEQKRAPLGGNADMKAAVDALKASGDIPPETNASAERVAELELELAQLKDRALRAMADADNTKKRAEREVANAKVYGVERFARDVLEVYDNLQRAMASVDEKARADMGDNAQKLLEGLELTEKNLMAVLARHGVTAVPGQGEKFDPNVHQAVAQIPSEVEKGHVADVMQTGFRIGDRTLRAAMVAVSTGG